MRSISAFPILILAAACTAAPPDPRGVASDEVLLQVVASGRAESRPDQARFSAGVQTIAPSAAAASTGNNRVIEQVAASLERLGIARDDIQTRQIGLNRIDYGPERGRFQANNVIEVRVRQIDRAGQAIAAATEAGANIVAGPTLVLADPEAASRNAYAAAYKAARARAEAYAGAAGLRVKRVLAIRDGGGGGAIPYPQNMDAASTVSPQTAAPPPVFRPGMNSSEVAVRADFALGE